MIICQFFLDILNYIFPKGKNYSLMQKIANKTVYIIK